MSWPEDLTDEQFEWLRTRVSRVGWEPRGPGTARVYLSAHDVIRMIALDAGLASAQVRGSSGEDQPIEPGHGIDHNE